jgi:hypothetical protein
VRRRVESEPTGAEVLRDGVALGITPLELELAEGEVARLELRRRGHRSVTEQVTAESPATVSVRLPRREAPGGYPQLAPR